MLFQSPHFALFFAGVVVGVWLLPNRTWRHAALLVASYVFYAAWDPRFLTLIWASTAIDFFVGRRLAASADRKARKRWLALSVTANLGILGVFKYLDFFATSAAALADAFGVTLSPVTLDLVLPVGISFYTFQSMSYTIDVYRGRIPPEPSALRFALYVAFFPQLVAGPIVRARTFLPQLARDRRPRGADLAPGALLFAIGLFKKIAMADRFGAFADPVFAAPELWSAPALLAAAGAYTAQIYCDFSGYSDMAIGLGRILGYRLPRNFDRPYSATSLRAFWRRWHISLSSWLRDYLYISLGGNRSGPLRTARNLFLTMLLGGLWHGAAWTFLLWGAWHGAVLGLERAVRRRARAAVRRWRPAWGWAVTMSAVVAGWVVFRVEALPDAERFARAIASWSPGVEALAPGPSLGVALLFGLFCFGQTPASARLERSILRLGPTAKMACAGAGIALAHALSLGGQRVFIYFQF